MEYIGKLTVVATLMSTNGSISNDHTPQKSFRSLGDASCATTTFVISDGSEITASADDPGLLQLKVTDTGAGMSNEQLGELFNEGVQFNVNKLQAGQGSGLGLYIARGIVEQHGGTLTAASDGLGQGTTFTVTVPLYRILETAPEPRSVPFGNDDINTSSTTRSDHSGHHNLVHADTPPTNEEGEKLRILVVDDALTNRKLLMRLLHNRGHDCDGAKDGVEAVKMVVAAMEESRSSSTTGSSSKMYDSILLDYEMPEMDGPTAARKIRELGCDAFIVGITGNVLPEDVTYFQNSGANCVMPKPINMESLEGIWDEFGITGQCIQ